MLTTKRQLPQHLVKAIHEDGSPTIEEVLRFCIIDLGVEPLSDDWDARLLADTELSAS